MYLNCQSITFYRCLLLTYRTKNYYMKYKLIDQEETESKIILCQEEQLPSTLSGMENENKFILKVVPFLTGSLTVYIAGGNIFSYIL